jgi:hypothetical protein
MADLGQVIGALLTSLAHARRIADEETAAIAEYYKSHPLLEGLSLPRIRVPEMVIEMPIVIDGQEEGDSSEINEPEHIQKALMEALLSAARRVNIDVPTSAQKRFADELGTGLARIRVSQTAGRGVAKEAVVQVVDAAFSRTLAEEMPSKPTQTQIRRVRLICVCAHSKSRFRRREPRQRYWFRSIPIP